MKRRLFLLATVMFVCTLPVCGQPAHTSHSLSSLSAQDQASYDREKKNPTTAVVLALFIPSGGHAYAGNWTRGLMFAGGEIAGIVLAATAGTSTEYNYDPDYYWASYGDYTTQTTPWLYIGIGTAVVFAVWGAIDASNEVEKYNERLLEGHSQTTSFGMNVITGPNGPQFQCSYHF